MIIPPPDSVVARRVLSIDPIFLRSLILVLASGVLVAGCASWRGIDPPRVQVIGLEPLPGEEMEARFGLELRIQNPNDDPIDYAGIAVELEVNDRPFAMGVSDARGSIPGFSEAVLTLPVSISAWSMMRQMFGLMDPERRGGLPFVLRGKLGGGTRAVRFESEGMLDLPSPAP